jgi:Lysophospholipase L1 and related esterases
MFIDDNATVLFQGDSVTDGGRDCENLDDMGFGYPMMTASWFAALHPEKNVRFINKGISGDQVKDLKSRWDKDCIQLKPTLVSILIGINDCWRRFDSNDPTPVEQFASTYTYILDRLQEADNPKIILCEPFVLPALEDRRAWREDLDPKIHVVRELARQYKALLLPLDGIFSSAASFKEPGFWTPDGVHPSPAGHALIAKEWLKLTQSL